MMRETKTAVKAAEEAGKTVMKHFGDKLKIKKKRPREFVTEVDLESNKKIISILKKAFPDYGIYSEETPEEKAKNGSKCRWVIDPVDGTHNFTYGLPLFGISIALEREGKIVLGVINLPYYKELYVAERGRGSFMNGKRIRVSERGVKEAMTIFGGDIFNPDKKETAELMRRLSEGTFEMRMLGSAVIHYAHVARGEAEMYVQVKNKPWDNAAGFLLVEEAGGKVTDFSGRGWDTNTIQFVASNGVVHEEILRIINQ